MAVVFDLHILITITCTQKPYVSLFIHFLDRHWSCCERLTSPDISTKETGVALPCQFFDFFSCLSSAEIFPVIFRLVTINTVHGFNFLLHQHKRSYQQNWICLGGKLKVLRYVKRPLDAVFFCDPKNSLECDSLQLNPRLITSV